MKLKELNRWISYQKKINLMKSFKINILDILNWKIDNKKIYNCNRNFFSIVPFKFKKGTEKFNDCVFKLYTAELDIQKLELEKQVAEANAKTASNEQLRAEALARAQIAEQGGKDYEQDEELKWGCLVDREIDDKLTCKQTGST